MVALTEMWSSLFVITSTKPYGGKKKASLLHNGAHRHISASDLFLTLTNFVNGQNKGVETLPLKVHYE